MYPFSPQDVVQLISHGPELVAAGIHSVARGPRLSTQSRSQTPRSGCRRYRCRTATWTHPRSLAWCRLVAQSCSVWLPASVDAPGRGVGEASDLGGDDIGAIVVAAREKKKSVELEICILLAVSDSESRAALRRINVKTTISSVGQERHPRPSVTGALRPRTALWPSKDQEPVRKLLGLLSATEETESVLDSCRQRCRGVGARGTATPWTLAATAATPCRPTSQSTIKANRHGAMAQSCSASLGRGICMAGGTIERELTDAALRCTAL